MIEVAADRLMALHGQTLTGTTVPVLPVNGEPAAAPASGPASGLDQAKEVVASAPW